MLYISFAGSLMLACEKDVHLHDSFSNRYAMTNSPCQYHPVIEPSRTRTLWGLNPQRQLGRCRLASWNRRRRHHRPAIATRH